VPASAGPALTGVDRAYLSRPGIQNSLAGFRESRKAIESAGSGPPPGAPLTPALFRSQDQRLDSRPASRWILDRGLENVPVPTMSGGMKRVKFDNSQSIELQKALPSAELTPEQLTVMHIEGWLVDDHVCVQKPAGDAGWRVSLYPWGDRISGEFYFKADTVEYAKDVSRLGIDWDAVYEPRHYAKSAIYRQALSEISALRDAYEDGGYFKL
jgi:hypothetical protein